MFESTICSQKGMLEYRLLKLVDAAATGRSGRTKRPIICICNDQFAPVLKPLRKVARVFEFRQTRTSQLVARLQFICKREGLRVAASTLNKLVRGPSGTRIASLFLLLYLGGFLTLNGVSPCASAFDVWKCTALGRTLRCVRGIPADSLLL